MKIPSSEGVKAWQAFTVSAGVGPAQTPCRRMRGVPLVKGDKAETAAVRGSRDEKPQAARSGSLR